MDPALAGLAAAAGTALVQAMARDTWETTKQRLAKIFSRHSSDGQQETPEMAEELDATEARLRSPAGAAKPVFAAEPVFAEEARRWTALLTDFLAEHGEAVPEVERFVREAHRPAGRDSFNVVQQVSAGRDVYAAGRDQHVFQRVEDGDRPRTDAAHVCEPPPVYQAPHVDVYRSSPAEPFAPDGHRRHDPLPVNPSEQIAPRADDDEA